MSKNRTILYTLGVLTLILLGILVSGVYEIRQENQTISQIGNQADLANDENNLAGTIRSVRNTYSKDINKIVDLVIHSDDLVPFIDSVEKLGKDVGLISKTTSVVQDKLVNKDIKSAQIVHITIETEGSWSSNVKFISALENLPANASIESISLSLNDSTNDSNKIIKTTNKTWRSNITFFIYTFK